MVGDTDTPWQWGVHWMETQFLAIFLLFKKGTATSIFNNSPALYRFICSTCVQILGDLSVWTPKLCFSEVRKHIVKFKSWNSPASFFTIRVNFDKIQCEDYCIYRPNSFLSLNTYCLLKNNSRAFRYSTSMIIYVTKKMKTPEKNIFYAKYEIFPKIKLQLANADTVLGRRHVCIIIKKNNWNRKYSFGVESRIMKNVSFAPNAITKPPGVES